MKAPNGRDRLQSLTEDLEKRLSYYSQPFSAAEVEKQHSKSKLTVQERLDLLLDSESPRFEIGTFAAEDLYAEQGKIISAGVRVVLGKVSSRDCLVVANDSMVKAGTWFPLTIKKILRAQEIALENRLPAIYLVDSAGLFLPLESETFPDRDHAGRIFYNISRMSAAGIPQISAVLGPCVAGGAYIPALCDEILMVRGTGGIFLAGPHLVKAAIGEVTDGESLGGADTHAKLSGMADYEDETEEECLGRIRRLAAQWPLDFPARYPVSDEQPPESHPDRMLEVLPSDLRSSYDMRDLLKVIVDTKSWEEYKAEYGKTLLTGFARIEGRVVGIVANQRLVSQSATGEMQIGGVLYSDSSDKGARFVLNCNQKGVPLIFLQDVTGFMVGTRAEQGGIIKDGAKLVNAVSNSRVPKITVVVGNSNGAGNYALCGRAYDPRFVLAWPTASISVMGGEQAAQTLLSVEKTKRNSALTPEEEGELLARLRAKYGETSSPYYAAARLWVDAIIDPRETRKVLAHLLEVACRRDPPEDFKTGVLQV